jgi:hypothetical protein
MMRGACSTYGADEKWLKILVGKPEETRPLRKYRHRWDDNIKMDF